MKLNLLSIFILTSTFVFSQVDVNVKANGSVYISKASFVYVSAGGDYVIDTSGETIMDSDSNEFANLYVDGTSSGTAEYRSWATNSGTVRELLSPAVTGEAFNVFASRNSAVLPSGTITGGALMFGPFNNATNQYVEWASSATDVITAGIGYRTATSASGGGTLSFRGDVNTANVTVSLSKSSYGAGFDYANLIGNPYTTYISAADLVSALVSSNAADASFTAIYGWDGSATGTDGTTWDVINNVNAGSRLIPPGQGFFVISDDDGTNENLVFTPSMRRVSNAGDGFIAGRNSNSFNIDGQFKLKLNNNASNSFYRSEVYFLDNNASRGLDIGWDAGEYSLPSNFGIATDLAETSQNVALRMQCLDSSDLFNVSDELIIPLYVNAQAGQSYSISIYDVTLPSGAEIYLHDTLDDSFTLLNNDTYTFTPSSALNGLGRFYLRTQNETFDVNSFNFDNIDVKSISGEKTLMITGVLNSKTDLQVYDLTGRLIKNYSLDNNSADNVRSLDVSELSAAPYVITLNDAEGHTKEVKLIIN